jgi:uncharacterized protein (TIRG00374 family)
VLPLLLLGAAFWFLWTTVRDVGATVLTDVLADLEWSLFAAAFGANLLRYVVWATRWWLLLRPLQPVPWWSTFEALMASVFVNTVVPAARPLGGLVRARHLAARTGHPTGPFFGVALVDQSGYGLISVVLGVAVLPLALRGQVERRSADVGLLVAALAILVLLLAPLWRRRRLLAERIERRLPGTMRAVSGALTALRHTMVAPRTWGLVLCGATLVWLANIATYRLAAAALGADLGLVPLALAFSLGSLAGTASGTPGGAGTTESAALVPLLALGAPTDLALATILLARSTHYVTALVLGGACAWSGLRRRAAERDGPEREGRRDEAETGV